jgi:hypothetical protein
MQITRDAECIRNYKGTRSQHRKRTINSPTPLTRNAQSECNLITYSYTQAVKIPSSQDVTKQNNIQIPNAVQEQQTNDIVSMNAMSCYMSIIDIL